MQSQLISWALILFLCTCLGAADIPPERVLTLDDTVKLALHNSQALLLLQEDENISHQRVYEAQALFFPKLDLNANWSKFGVDGDAPLLLQPALGPTLIPDSPRENFYTARANIYQMVYAGGRTRNTYRQARISYQRAKTANEAVRVQVIGSAKEAFYNLLTAQEKHRAYEAVVKLMDAAMRRTPTPSLDGIRLERGLAALRAESAQAGMDEEQARLAYLQALGLELSTTLSLKGTLDTQPAEVDLQKMLAWASQYRSELRQTEFQEELDALGIRLSLAERTPTVAFGASYERTGHNIELNSAENWAGTLNLNVPLSISDVFYGRTKVRERKAQYRQATLKHAETNDQIQYQVRQAYGQYRFWQEELLPRESELERAKSLAASVRGKGGTGLERLEAEWLLLDAKVRYQEAERGHLVALAALERAVGHSLTSEM